MEHRASTSCQRNQHWLWMRQLRVAALSLVRVSLALIVVLLMVGFSLIFGDQNKVAHAAKSSSSLAGAAALGLAASGGSELAVPSLSIELPLSTYGAGQGITLILKNVTLVVKKLEIELELN